MMQVLYRILSAGIAFLAFAWVYKGATPLSQALVSNVALLASAICVGWLSKDLIVSSARRKWIGIISGFLLGIGVILLGVWWPWRGIDYIAASLLPGYLVGIAALALGIRGLQQASQGRGAYLLLAALGLAVLLGPISLHIRPSPERTVRRFARSIVARRCDYAYVLLTPELQRLLTELPRGSCEDVDTILREPGKVRLREVEIHGHTARVTLFRPRSRWGGSASFGRFDELMVEKQPTGEWLIAGRRRSDLLRGYPYVMQRQERAMPRSQKGRW